VEGFNGLMLNVVNLKVLWALRLVGRVWLFPIFNMSMILFVLEKRRWRIFGL